MVLLPFLTFEYKQNVKSGITPHQIELRVIREVYTIQY